MDLKHDEWQTMTQPPREWEDQYQTEESPGKWRRFLWIALIVALIVTFLNDSSHWPEINKHIPEDIKKIAHYVAHEFNERFGQKSGGSYLPKEKEPWRVSYKKGKAAMKTRRYRQAEDLFRECLVQGEKKGVKAIDLMPAQKALVEVLRRQRRWNEAEAFCRLVVENTAHAYGPEDPRLVRPLMDLNEIYLSMRRHDKLEPNYIRIIALNEKRYGKNHPVVASNLNSLAWLYSKRLGRLQEAEALYKRALTIWESKSGTVSKGAMNSVKGLITIYKTQGRTLELVELEDSLKKRQQEVSSIQLNRDKIPKKRPDYNKNNSKDLARLADSYDSSLEDAPLWLRYTETGRKACKTGKRKDGEILLLAALHELEPLENADPSRLTRILDPLAMNYYRLGRYIKAKSYYELMMQAYRKAHGVRHASVGTSLNNLGYICLKLRQYGDAEKYFNESIALFKGNGRGDDPMLAHSLEGLATVYINQGRASEVPPLYRRAKSIWEKREGRDGKNFKRVQKKYLNQ